MRSSSCLVRFALATSTLLFVVPAAADEPKEPLPAAPVAAAPAAPAAPDRIAEALAPQPGGLTPDEVGRLILRAKPSLRVKEAELREAAAKVDSALLNFIPRVTGTATYTRLSEVQNSLGTQTVFGTIQGTTFTPGIPTGGLVSSACPEVPLPNTQCVRVISETGQQSNLLAATQVPFNFPVLLNSYSFQAQLAVPVSDYLLRISQAYAAASHARDAKKIELKAAELQASADAKVSFFNWVTAKGASVVATEALATVDAHLVDIKRIVDAGLASRADLLRLEAQKASAEQFKVNADAFTELAEQSMRVTLGIPADKPISIGVDVLHQVPSPTSMTLVALQDEALSKRLELRQLVESERAMGSLVSIARAQYLPRVDAFANATVANPNQRIFPAIG
jgi:outer membrane protein